MQQCVLVIAFQFPPFAGSSGVQRTLRFVQHLPVLGWEPIVLSAHPRAYESTSNDLLAEIPGELTITRAFALDAARHFSVLGRYPGFLGRPDRWMTWRFAAVRAGERLIKEFSPRAIWSTFPIASAHMIAAELHRRSRLPWIADFRDPMAQVGYPADPKTWQSYKQIEERAIRCARFSMFTTPSALRTSRNRYPAVAPDRFALIENGYDEESFAASEQLGRFKAPLNAPGCVTMLHSGAVYPDERDPTRLFDALGQLRRQGIVTPQRLRVRFRAPGHEEFLRKALAGNRLEDIVEIHPPIGYRDALDEMLRADALLVLQAANCNEQIPAKIYEYFRARRPILCLTDPAGDTAATVRGAGIKGTFRLDSAADIADALRRFLLDPEWRQGLIPEQSAVAAASRRARSAQLATLLNAATA